MTRLKMPGARGDYWSTNNYDIEALDEFCTTLGAMNQIMKESMPALSTPAEQSDGNLIEKFKSLESPIFLREGGVEKAERLLMQPSIQQAWEEEEKEPTWDGFLEVFNKKYFPESVKERKEVEFIELQQGNLTIDQYVAKFLELSRYAPHIINTEARKASKFERGLQPDIKGRVLSINLKAFSQLVDLARKVKNDCDEYRLRKEKRRTWPTPSEGPREKESRRNNKTQKTSKGDVKQSFLMYCTSCGKQGHVASKF
ncbi:uncharacterized protein LOC105420461 [Amborella trichopoda]|uniref:uncharacterized protein LOC105420461 n=1 Tax=Amborella trichopoda TaxID=13333 RepID=UPI0005D34A38|nr:uncharacterized protein LOC105420461 [Amborella trichopoda]|eukprot:XP_011622429.1 uncharacterized protein LOC105420461 [Amborella trichopoda]